MWLGKDNNRVNLDKVFSIDIYDSEIRNVYLIRFNSENPDEYVEFTFTSEEKRNRYLINIDARMPIKCFGNE